MNAATTIALVAVVLILVASLYYTVRGFRAGGCSGCCNKGCCCKAQKNDSPREKN
ncbi:MAG: hypothetical protein WCQ23_05125 [Candidatus Methanomethylophilaceae archaeon]|jgi:hypothetical protein